jgi:inosine-uridine nucleoside N-ribohydrolase
VLTKQKVILDVDTGTDDAVAILMAGHAASLELVAVTVTHGNGSLELTLRNTLKVVDAGGLVHVPVMAGASRPLVRDLYLTQGQQRTELPLPEPSITPSTEHAADFLRRYYINGGDDTVLVPMAPLTNIALALMREPAMAGRIPRIVLMGGAVGAGNTTVSAEFNILADPEAARIVFNAGIPITMIGLEVTAGARLRRANNDEIRALGTPQSRIVADLIDLDLTWAEEWSSDGVEVYDACAVAAVIDPSVVTTQRMHVDIETQGALTLGRTVCDTRRTRRRAKNQPHVDVGLALNRQRFLEVLMDCLH